MRLRNNRARETPQKVWVDRGRPIQPGLGGGLNRFKPVYQGGSGRPSQSPYPSGREPPGEKDVTRGTSPWIPFAWSQRWKSPNSLVKVTLGKILKGFLGITDPGPEVPKVPAFTLCPGLGTQNREFPLEMGSGDQPRLKFPERPKPWKM